MGIWDISQLPDPTGPAFLSNLVVESEPIAAIEDADSAAVIEETAVAVTVTRHIGRAGAGGSVGHRVMTERDSSPS